MIQIATKLSTGPPNITVHPSSQLIITNATLHCEGIGNGSIRYQWEMSSTSEGPWVQINDGNGSNLVVNSVSQSQHYRCVVANQAGIAISSVATVNVLSEFVIIIFVINCVH